MRMPAGATHWSVHSAAAQTGISKSSVGPDICRCSAYSLIGQNDSSGLMIPTSWRRCAISSGVNSSPIARLVSDLRESVSSVVASHAWN